MAGTRDIKRRLVSVRNTRKITYAMKLVSAAKLRRAQESVVRSREYTETLGKLIGELAAELRNVDFSHPLAENRTEIKNVGVLVIGGGRGLCGGYNTNVNRKIEAVYRELSEKRPGANIKAIVVGKKPAEYFRRVQKSYETSYEVLSEDANRWPLEEICLTVENAFLTGQIDELYIVYTKFKSALSMTVQFDKLLPLEGGVSEDTNAQSSGVVVEPSLKRVVESALVRVLRSKIRQAALDAKASEHASRMTAMDAATKNAGDLIRRLQLAYNKLRQAGITAELLDIIGGAEAIK